MATNRGDEFVGIQEPHTPGAASKRIAEALGWDKVPEITEQERRDADEALEAARQRVRDAAA